MIPSRSDELAALLAATLQQSPLPRHERAALVRFLEQHLARERELDAGDARCDAGFADAHRKEQDE